MALGELTVVLAIHPHALRTGEGLTVFPQGSRAWFDDPVALAELSDGDLVAQCRAGVAEAWDELVRRFSRYVYAIATQAYRLGPSDAEEVFQEVFARTYEHLDKRYDEIPAE